MNVGLPDHSTLLEATFAVPRRGRGRPRGSRTRICRFNERLGFHHFAFLRSWYLRLDTRTAWGRYMAAVEASSDLRFIERRRRELLKQVLHAGEQLDLGLPAEQRFAAELGLLARGPEDVEAPALPSLEEFIESQGLDPEFYSEAEVLQEYRAFHGLDERPEHDTLLVPSGKEISDRQVRALNRLEALVARSPQAADQLDGWLSPALTEMLRQQGVHTLGELIEYLHARGYAWYRRIRGLGEVRAKNLVEWLVPIAEQLSRPLPGHVHVPPQLYLAQVAAAGKGTPLGKVFGIVPLERLAVPTALAGSRAGAPGEPANDLDAIQAWLETHRGSPATFRAYNKEAERFYLWCLQVRRKALSSIELNDLDAYQAFLESVPQDWINHRRAPTTDSSWRPFRGALSAASRRAAAAAVLALCRHLKRVPDGISSRHARDGCTSLGSHVSTPLQATREILTRRWAKAGDGWLLGLGDSASARRLKLIGSLLSRTGLSLRELTCATLELRHAHGDRALTFEGIRVHGTDGSIFDIEVDSPLGELIVRHRIDSGAGQGEHETAVLFTLRSTVSQIASRDAKLAESFRGARLSAYSAAKAVRRRLHRLSRTEAVLAVAGSERRLPHE